jgi:lipoprotein-releasing system permease protein
MRLLAYIAFRHLMARKRQSIVSLLGIVIGVGFFLAISSMMQGSQRDFISRLVDKSPHITISDEYREPEIQPIEQLHPEGLVELRSIKPQADTRGIRGYRQVVEYIEGIPNLRVSAVQAGQGILSFAGRDANIQINGIIPQDLRDITTLQEDMKQGSIDDLIANRNGIIVGQELLRKYALSLNDNITVASAVGQVRTFKIVGVFRTGNAAYDEGTTYADIKRIQALMNRPDRANSIIIKMGDPQAAQTIAKKIEEQIGYKTVSWQEQNEGILNTLVIRNIIMYSVVSAVLIVAAFGIYNIISTVVMEKQRDIAILKSMGFKASDVKNIFIIQGVLLGIAGIMAGLPFGALLMTGLGQIVFRPPGIDPLKMPLDWGVGQFLIAGAFAMGAALLASWLPARKGARVLPVDILRGLH